MLIGWVLDIVKWLDFVYVIIIGGYIYQVYMCKIGGCFVVQVGSYGGWIIESCFKFDVIGYVFDVQVVNYLVLQLVYVFNFKLVELVVCVVVLIVVQCNKLVVMLLCGVICYVKVLNGDFLLGNFIVDSQFVFVCKQGVVDVVFMNLGGICVDLMVELGKFMMMSDLLVIQFFGNDIVGLMLIGQQFFDILQCQLF